MEYLQRLWDEVMGGSNLCKRLGKKKVEMMRRGLRMALEKVRRRGLCRLPSIRLVVLFFYFLTKFLFFCDLNV